MIVPLFLIIIGKGASFEGRSFGREASQVFVRLPLCPLSGANRLLMGLAEYFYGYKKVLSNSVEVQRLSSSSCAGDQETGDEVRGWRSSLPSPAQFSSPRVQKSELISVGFTSDMQLYIWQFVCPTSPVSTPSSRFRELAVSM
jgi:hypothetical protein